MDMFMRIFDWVIRLTPAVALFSLFFVMEGNLRWLGLFGFIPLLLQRAGCTACYMRHCDTDADSQKRGWPTFPGH